MSENEEKIIMDFFGVNYTDGNVIGKHFLQILTFLKIHDGKEWGFVEDCSPLYIKMHYRTIKESYLAGLIRMGIIKLYTQNHKTFYKWIGESALNGKLSMKEIEPPKEKTKEVLEGTCKGCGKDLSGQNKIFCDTECMKNYYNNRRNGE